MSLSMRSVLPVLLVTSALVACGGDQRDPGFVDSCTESADTCGGNSICISGLCEPAFPRIYSISVDEVVLEDRDPAGDCWDIPCGPPDPYVVIQVDGREVGRTQELNDRFDGSWSNIFDVPLDAGDTLEIIVLDTDVDNDDEAVTCSARPVDAGLLRARALSCGDRGISNFAHVTIDPR